MGLSAILVKYQWLHLGGACLLGGGLFSSSWASRLIRQTDGDRGMTRRLRGLAGTARDLFRLPGNPDQSGKGDRSVASGLRPPFTASTPLWLMGFEWIAAL